MSAESEKKTISFRIKAIDLLSKALNLPTIKDGKVPEHEFNIGLEISVSEENKTTVHILNITISDKNDKSVNLGSIKIACAFDILNFEEIVTRKEDGTVDFPNEYLDLLNTITIGTARGVMYSEFKGTFLHHTILPILDVKSFVYAEKEIVESA